MLSSLLLGCSQSKLQSSGEYVSKDNTIVFKIPEVLIGAKIHEKFTDGIKFVEILDDFGHLYEVEAISIPSNFKSLPAEAILNNLLEDEINLIKSKVPDATVLKKEFLPQFQGGAILVVVLTPNGSSVVVSENGGAYHRVDSVRYIMFFCQNDAAIMATYMFTNSLEKLRKDYRPDAGQINEKNIETLTQFSASVYYKPKK